MRKWILVSGVVASFMLAVPGLARTNALAGQAFHLVGTTATTLSYRENLREPQQMGIRFADDTFEASSVRGDYRQRGRRLRLSVEDALLDEWEALWEEDFADHLRQAGNVVDRVRCRTTRSELKGRARRGALRFRMRHKFR
ncbi:MAG: hypothetical protein VCC20_12340, partial [Myxococcota bacterium]